MGVRKSENAVRTESGRKHGIYALLAAAALCASIRAAGAWNTVGYTLNRLKMADFQLRIQEEYHPPEQVFPTDTVEKKVYVVNTGTADAIVRVRLDKELGANGPDGTFQPDASLDPDLIRLYLDDTGTWLYSEDGYAYYTGILEPGERTKEPVMKAFVLEKETPNACMGAQGRILVRMEGVQAEGEAVRQWGISKEQIGITYQNVVRQSGTDVVFAGREEGFLFSAKDTDLFSSFKSLLPGSARLQTIRITNESEEETSIWLRAQETKQEDLSPEEAELLKKLLSEYARIRIEEGEYPLYQGPVDGNLQAGETEESMGRRIPLGKFRPREGKSLRVTLSVSPEMGNEYMDLLGKVRWVFEAEDASSDYPDTGDPTPLTGCWFLVLASLTAAWVSFARLRREKSIQEESAGEGL